jgi:hypothetical protein
MNLRPMLIAVMALAMLPPRVLPQGSSFLARHYTDGERVSYLMKGSENETSYEVGMTATTAKRADGQFFESLAWSDMKVDGQPRSLSPAAEQFRLAVTTEGVMPFALPDLSKAEGLIAPVTDAMTFYADLFIARRQSGLRQSGDRATYHNPTVASWADGRRVLIGEDHVEFEIALADVDAASGVGVLLIKHVPPAAPQVRLNAEWMRAPVADTSNNWVMVSKTGNGYAVSVGKETFDVELRVALRDGRLLSATLDNPVTAIIRECADQALTQCGPPRPSPVLRRVMMSRVDD